jgi:hypothetical protein
LSTEEKSLFSKNVSRHRNYAFVLYIITAIIDFFCVGYYGGKGGALLVFANCVLLTANGGCGIVGALTMNIYAILCNFTWVLIIMITYLFLIAATFIVAEDSGINLIAMIIPTFLDCMFMCALFPFLY